MKVVHVVESLAVGGLEQVVISLAAWQRAQGIESTIVCLFHEGALAAGARARGVEVAVIGKASGLDVRALFMLRSSLRRLAPDVLHTHNAVAHYYAVAAAAGLGIARTVNTRHGMGSRAGGRRLELLYRAALRRTDAAVAVCYAARDRFVRAGTVPAAKTFVVANGVDLGAIAVRCTAAREALLAQLALAPATVVLGIVGRLNPVKDHATLLRALQQVRQKELPVALVVVGDGPTRAALEAQAGSLGLGGAVRFLGMRGDVGQLLAAFDLFVLSSTTEGYSLALVEAAAAGLPIVATRVGGNADIVSDRISGLLVPAREGVLRGPRLK
ncbi:MAG TPA: glycosyltransferase, partial [Burkholderiaceae bacterium]|nr:glycosyltransferase [Burkholderiaceae bacterium]